MLYVKKRENVESRVITRVFCEGKVLEVDTPFGASIFPDISTMTEETFIKSKLAFHQPIARFDDVGGNTRMVLDAKGNLGLGRHTTKARLTLSSQDDNQQVVTEQFRAAPGPDHDSELAKDQTYI